MQLFFFLLAPCIINSFSEAQTPRGPRPDSSISIFYLRTDVLPFQTRHTENPILDPDARPAAVTPVKQLENSLRWRYGVSEAHWSRASLNGCKGEVDLCIWKEIWAYWTYNLASVQPTGCVRELWKLWCWDWPYWFPWNLLTKKKKKTPTKNLF